MSLSDDLNQVVELTRAAGRIVLEHYGKVERLTKRHDEAVTEADRATQRFIIAGLRERFPGTGFVGEESDSGKAITFECPDPRGRVWVIDPIDGTNNFITGFGNFAVCIGLLEAGQPVLGVVYDVTRETMYQAARGHGAWRNQQPIKVAATSLSESSIVMSSSNLIDPRGRAPAWPTRWLGRMPWKMRILGSAALEAMQVAAGVAHGAVVLNGKLWDVVAPAAILLEAGGKLTDPQGRPIFPFSLENYGGERVPILAAAPAAQETLLRELRDHA